MAIVEVLTVEEHNARVEGAQRLPVLTRTIYVMPRCYKKRHRGLWHIALTADQTMCGKHIGAYWLDAYPPATPPVSARCPRCFKGTEVTP